MTLVTRHEPRKSEPTTVFCRHGNWPIGQCLRAINHRIVQHERCELKNTPTVTDRSSDQPSATAHQQEKSRKSRDDARRLGQAIRTRRLELGMSQTRLGMLMGGLDQKEVSRLERGSIASPPPERLRRVATALNLEPTDLMTRAEWPGFEQTVALGNPDQQTLPSILAPADQRLLSLFHRLSRSDRGFMMALAERLSRGCESSNS